MASEREAELEKMLSIATGGTERIDILNTLAVELLEQDPTRSRGLAEDALRLGYAQQLDGHFYIRGNAEALITLGELANNADAYGLALTHLMEAYTLLQGQLFPDLLANTSHAIGWAHFRLGNYAEALNFMGQALTFYRELLNREKEAALLTSLGTVYSAMDNHALAMENFQRALILQNSQHTSRARGVTLNNLAYAQVMLGVNDGTVKNALEALQIFRALDLRPLEARALDTLGRAYFCRGDFLEAEKALEQCLEISQQFGLDYLEMEAMGNLGKIYIKQGRKELAVNHFNVAVSTAEMRHSNRFLYKYNEILAGLYEEQGILDQALQHFKRFHQTMELAMAEAANYRIENLKVLHQVEKNQKEAEVLLLQNQALEKEIDERLHERALLEKQATTDPLTGLYNRRHFTTLGEYELEKFQKGGAPITIIFVDIDHFKLVNDQYSHSAGDRVLIELAGIFMQFTQQGEICCRFGGEEFLIMMPNSDLASGLNLARRICETVAATPFTTEHGAIRITTSLGVAQAEITDLSLETIIARADQAQYRAKSAGRNRVST